MSQLNLTAIIIIVCSVSFMITVLDGSPINWSTEKSDTVEQVTDENIANRIQAVGNLIFDNNVLPTATIRRKIACLFVFDKDASADLNNNLNNAISYANQLATLASKYTAHANIVVTNAGTEMWSTGDKISFDVESNIYSTMSNILTQFQTYLANTYAQTFGSVYAVGVLIANKTGVVSGGYTQGPPCTTFGASLINYRPYPWSIAGLLAHELAHTLSVVHPFDLPLLCTEYKTSLKFCGTLPDECLCSSNDHPPQQCLMTYQFGLAAPFAPKYTSCDIEMMNYFAPNVSCVTQA